MEAILTDSVPKLAPKARLKYDKVRDKHLLLLPEKVVVLNETAASILALCDGFQTLHTLAESLRSSLRASLDAPDAIKDPNLREMEKDITTFVQEMADQGWVVVQ